MKPNSHRRGYALMMVMVFIVLFLGMLGVAFRQTAAALRIESVRTLQVQRDEGSMHALARGLALLETGAPPADPYQCGVTIATSSGDRDFTLTFSSEGTGNWSVQATPTATGEFPTPIPTTFIVLPM